MGQTHKVHALEIENQQLRAKLNLKGTDGQNAGQTLSQLIRREAQLKLENQQLKDQIADLEKEVVKPKVETPITKEPTVVTSTPKKKKKKNG